MVRLLGCKAWTTIACCGTLAAVHVAHSQAQTTVPSQTPVLINEVEAVTAGPASAGAFIELFDGGAGNTPLEGLVLVCLDGATDLTYAAFDLTGKSTDARGYFVLGDASITTGLPSAHSLTMARGLLHTGQDAVALFAGSVAAFPHGASLTTAGLVDALVYGAELADDAELARLLNPREPQVDESGGGSSPLQSMQRSPDGSGGLRNSFTYAPSAPTPFAPNAYTNTVAAETATPATTCASESATLTGSVGSAETIVWRRDRCDGPFEGEDRTIIVSPQVTTTYFGAAKNISSGCVGSVCAEVTVVVTPPSLWFLDADGDGVGDEAESVLACSAPAGYVGTSGDGCPADPLKLEPGACGCGFVDNDTDGDGTPDCIDGCPEDPAKIDEGTCGCGVPDTDTDRDGTPDCDDGYPKDPLKLEEGTCGCGVADQLVAFYPDADSDTYGDANASPTEACADAPPEGFVADNTDCDDSDSAIHPGAPEVCDNTIDDDCNGFIDDVAGSQSTVYLDDDFANLPDGADPDGLGPIVAIGCDAFASAAEALEAVAAGGTVVVRPGVYPTNLTISRSVTIQGPFAGVCPGTSLDRGDEAVFIPGINAPLGGVIFFIAANNVTIDGITVNGDNPAMNNGEFFNGVDVNAAAAIGNGSYDDAAGAAHALQGLTVTNTIIQNFNDVGIPLLGTGTRGEVASGHTIMCNRLDNMQGKNSIGETRTGIVVLNDAYAMVADNVITRVSIGVQTGNNTQPMPLLPAGETASVRHNIINFDDVAIWHDRQSLDASTWTIATNDLASIGNKQIDTPCGIYISSIQDAVSVIVMDNLVLAAYEGVRLWNNPTENTITIEGGSLIANFIGVYVTTFDAVQGEAAPSGAKIQGTTMLSTAGGEPRGVFVDGSGGSAEISVEITGISAFGFDKAIVVEGKSARAYIHDNPGMVTANNVGIAVSGGRARIESTELSGNFIAGVLVREAATVDLGDCGDTDFTGLGSSQGLNALTGYNGTSAWAVYNQNSPETPVVLAQNNYYGYPSPVENIEDVVFDDTDSKDSSAIIASQALDTDGDGVFDCHDGCPLDPAKTSPGVCGCGIADTDTDRDGVADCDDGCPQDPLKTAEGTCGCGVADTDSDGDGTPDCNDGCPKDPLKIVGGKCGCGVADTDTDNDGTPDCKDGCPKDPAKIAEGICGCGIADVDSDGDGAADCIDGCPKDPEKTEPLACGCGVPDIDSDGDGSLDCDDGCPDDPDKTAPGECGCGVPDVDTDGDGALDCTDECPADPDKIEPGACGCGTPDTDTDGDGVPDCIDQCPGYDDTADCNENGTPDGCDIHVDQTSSDLNNNSVPDECECLADLTGDGMVGEADLAILFGSWGTVVGVGGAGGVADLDSSGTVDATDLAILLGSWGPCAMFVDDAPAR
ncbi:MAG: hypothetical protein SGJ11_10545 [Phycisphaerae bacterium]|nr:hypothetical protein [Phycisphaerae bacterium]